MQPPKQHQPPSSPPPLAVVGYALRYPGDASNVQSFWDMLVSRKCASSTYPPDRFNIASHHNPTSNRLDTLSITGGHFLTGDLSAFDAPFFSLTATEAEGMDPQQRIALEVAYQALENAGLTLDDVDGSKMCVFSGSSSNDYGTFHAKDPMGAGKYAAYAQSMCMIANRVSWAFNLRGPSANVDTACSSSLVALDTACRSVWSGASESALALGANLILIREFTNALDNLGFFSPDNRCFSFDEQANGYSRGEGLGALIIKPLDAAIEAGDTIRAVIRSTLSNQDGKTPGITNPSRTAQRTLIEESYLSAGLDFDKTRYFEAHGTGTAVGDPTETRAIGAVFRGSRSNEDPLYLGSVKSNIGHLEGASGIAGVIKVILALEKGIIPPVSENYKRLNPRIDAEHLHMQVVSEPTPWPEGLRRASVSSFGFGGANSHAILDDAYHTLKEMGLENVGRHCTAVSRAEAVENVKAVNGVNGVNGTCETNGTHVNGTIDHSPEEQTHLLTLSSADKEGLERLAGPMEEYLSKHPDVSLQNLAYTLNERRTHHAWRSYALADSTQEGNDIIDNRSMPIQALEDPVLGFVFTGQGAQWPTMGRELVARYPVYREALRDAGAYLRSLGAEWDVLDVLTADKGAYAIDLPEFAQPLCTATQIALVDLLSTFGIRPDAVVGHSSGEIAAAYAQGSISTPYALKLAYFRGVFAGKLASSSKTNGGMMAVSLPASEIAPYLEECEGKVVIACYNSPKSITLSGEKDQLEKLQERLTGEIQGVLAKVLPVPVGYHSFQMQEVMEGYAAAVGDDEGTASPNSASKGSTATPSRENKTRMISSVHGHWITTNELSKASYWVRNLISPVRFADAVGKFRLRSSQAPVKKIDGSHRDTEIIDVFFEVGPHSALRGPCRDTLLSGGAKGGIEYLSALLRNKSATSTLLEAVGRLHCLGHKVNLGAVNPPSSSSNKGNSQKQVLTDLPAYTFNHTKSYWAEGRISKGFRFRKYGRHELLGWPDDDWNPLMPKWSNILQPSDPGWVRDHTIDNVTLLPGAAMITMAVEAVKQVTETPPESSIRGFELKNVNFRAALKVAQGGSLETRFHLHPAPPGSDSKWFGFTLSSFDGSWVVNCDGAIRAVLGPAGVPENNKPGESQSQEIRKSELESFTPATRFYELFTSFGYQFGPAFLRVAGVDPALENSNSNSNSNSDSDSSDIESLEALTYLAPYIPTPTPHWSETYTIHPATLDGLLQTLAVLRTHGGTRKMPMAVPRHVQRAWISADSPGSGSGDGEFGVRTRFESIGRQEALAHIGTVSRGVQLEGVILATIDGVGGEDEEEGVGCQRVEWGVDLNLLSKEEVQKYCEGVAEGDKNAWTVYLDALAHKEPGMDILVNSAEPVAASMIQTLRVEGSMPRFTSLDISGSDVNLETLQKGLGEYASRVAVKELDLQKGLDDETKYDLVVVDQGDKEVLKNARASLKSAGKLVVIGASSDLDTPLRDIGLSGADLVFKGETSVIVSSVVKEEKTDKSPVVVVYNPDVAAQKALATQLSNTAYTLDEALSTEIPSSSTVCILNELGQQILSDIDEGTFTQFQKLFSSSIGKFLWVNDAASPHSRSADGLSRVLNSELSKDFAVLSLESTDGPKLISRVLAELKTENPETEYIERSGTLHIPRISHSPAVSNALTSTTSKQPILQPWNEETARKFHIQTPGLLDSLVFIPDTDRGSPLPKHMIEVQVKAAGVNFRDILVMLGRMDQTTVGFECAGIVTAVGEDCQEDFKVGDAVAGTEFDIYRTYARLQKDTAVKIPAGVSWTQAAALPINFVTAWHALVVLANVQKGERVLVHSAAGGTGQAAVQVAQYHGAEVFATVGSDKKRSLLKEQYGIADDHIFSSRTLDFVAGVKGMTNNQGVDVILNSLSGDSLSATWELIAPYGSFIEIGKRDILNHRPLDMYHFEKNVTFSAMDMALMVQQRPALVGRCLAAVMPLVAAGKLRPSFPQSVYGVGEMEAGLRNLQGGQNAGKVVIEMRDEDVIRAIPSAKQHSFDSNATYVIAGGLGGLGKGITKWMADCGARSLLLLSRRGARDEDKPFIQELTDQGVTVLAPPCDITDATALQSVLSSTSHLPPIKGCIQATMVLKDAIFENMTHAQWKTATAPKIAGSWNLHSLLPRDLDFFIMMSSIASVIGNKGQANYAAANSFMDGLADFRKKEGKNATALNLGLFLDAGVATQNVVQREKYLANLPFAPVTEQQLHALLAYHTATDASESGAGAGSESQTICGLEPSKHKTLDPANHPYLARPNFRFFSLAHLSSTSPSTSTTAPTSIDLSSPESATASITTLLTQKLSSVLGTPLEEFDTSKPMHAYGVDSLVAVEIRNWFGKEIKADMAIFDILGGNSIEGVAGGAAGKAMAK